MPKIIIIPHYHYESQFAAFLNKTNAVQGDFSFYLLPPQNSDPSSPLALPSSDYSTILKFLFSQKQKMGFTDEDMLVAFYDGKISAREYALSNLFIAGANIEDQYPCTAVISLKFISWGILEQKYDYTLQQHALFHLVMCALIGCYTKVQAHHQTFGCLLDFNNQLVDFNHKLQMGYYLCSATESNCYQLVKSTQYGNSITRLCSGLRGSIDQEKLQIIIKELIMGDNIQQGENATLINRSTVTDSFNQSSTETKQAIIAFSNEVERLLEQLRNTNPNATEIEQVTYVNVATNPDLKQRAIAAFKEGTDTAIDEFILENKYIKVAKAVVKGWLQPGG